MTGATHETAERVAQGPRRPLGRDLLTGAAALLLVLGALVAVVRLVVLPATDARGAAEAAEARARLAALQTRTALTPRATLPPTRSASAAPPLAAPGEIATATPSADAGGRVAPAPAPGVEATATAGLPPTGAAAPGAELAATLPPAVDPALAEAVLNAYQRYWEVRVLMMGDPARTDLDLGSVMADVELARAREVLAKWSQEGRAYRTTVRHQLRVGSITPAEAVLLDEYTMTSEKLDPSTREPGNAEPIVEQATVRFFLQNADGAWRVVDQEGES